MAALRAIQGQGQTLQRLCAEVPKVASCQVVQKRKKSTNLATFKRGRGGRSSFSGIVATVIGSSGFLGKYVVNKLGKIGSQVICPYRSDPYFMKELKLAGDLGQILFMPYNLKDEESLRKCMQYSNVVINLVGRDWETKNYSYQEVHMNGAQRIAQIAKECGVQKFIHFSALNASPSPSKVYIPGGSRFLKSKFYGEELVREQFPEAVIMRPSDMYGPEDRFLRYYANHWRRTILGNVPLWKRGTQTIKMPVFVSDVAEGVINAIFEPDSNGKTYECVGPHSYYLSDLVDYFYRVMRRDGTKRTYMNPIFMSKVMYMSYAPSYPILSLEKIEKDHVSDVLSYKALTLDDLGVKLTRIEDRAPFELKPFKKHSYYEEKVGEFAPAEPPPVLA